MKLYIMRALRYILRTALIVAAALGILALTGTLNTGGRPFAEAFFGSTEGAILIAALLLLGIVYPQLAFTTVKVRGNIINDREEIKRAFESSGYYPVFESETGMVFRTRSFGKKLATQFDDAITVTGIDGRLEVEGLKKEVVRMELRLNTFLGNN